MLDDRSLAAAGDEHEFFDARLTRFVHRVLDQRAVDDRQQFLGDRLGGGKEPGAQARDREYGLLHGLAERVGHRR